jgi:hypothetical protein
MLPLASRSQGVVLVLGFHTGLGALIRSAVNSIWLATKLCKSPYIYWGRSCLYFHEELGGNIYTRLFAEPLGHGSICRVFHSKTVVYPPIYSPLKDGETIDSLDCRAKHCANHTSQKLTCAPLIQESDLCIVRQHLSDHEAMALLRTLGIPTSESAYTEETEEIFSAYFRPTKLVTSMAAKVWDESLGSRKGLVIGMHMRGTDKVIEKAVPSPRRYLRLIQKLRCHHQDVRYFLATDRGSYLELMKQKLGSFRIAAQDSVRSAGLTGLHFNRETAFQNAIEMTVDIELLARCDMVLAFPGSQIYWWLDIRRRTCGDGYKLLPVSAGLSDWLYAIIYALKRRGFQGLIKFLRWNRLTFLSLIK